MVLKPKQALKITKEALKITEKELNKVNQLEIKIDELIAFNSKHNLINHFFKILPEFDGVGYRVLDKIKEMYEHYYEVNIKCIESSTYICLYPKK